MDTKIKVGLTPYFSNKEIKKQIDELLHENAVVQSNLGIDSTKQEKEKAHGESTKICIKIEALDEQLAKSMFPEHYG
jgi:hypothetical protein|tara:strand:+ start:4086 stop:4316 length:231 start_codon:yes stop_codon:yes gene_type:complete